VGQELPRCTGFCLGLRTQGGEGIKLGGIKYGVWQLHILLMGYGVGVWTFPKWIDLATFITQHHQSHPFGLVAGFSLGLCLWCYVIFLALVECRDCLIFTGYPLLFPCFPCVGSTLGRSLLLSGSGFQGWLCEKKERRERKFDHRSRMKGKLKSTASKQLDSRLIVHQGKGSISGRRVSLSFHPSFFWH